MRSKQEQPKSRKKPYSQINQQSSNEIITSPNLKYDFLSKEPDQKLVHTLRAAQIDSILGNIYNFLSSLNNSIKAPKDKESYKKIMLLLGSPGTGKTVCANYILDQLQRTCKKNGKKYENIKRIQILSFNGNSTKKCDQIKKQMTKILTISGKQKLTSNYHQYEVSKNGQFVISVVFIEEIDQIIKNNNQSALEDFIDAFTDPYCVVNKQQQNEKDKKGIKEQINQYLLIGTSNSVNLQGIVTKKLHQQKKFMKVIFTPYNQESLCKIIRERVQKIYQRIDIKLKMQDKLIRYIISKLMQNKNDDTRCVIEIVKQLLVYAESKPDIIKLLEKGKQATLDITTDILLSITKIKNMLVNSKIDLIKKLSLKQQLILIILYRQIKFNQALQVPYMEIVDQYKKMHKNMGVNSYQDVSIAMNELETYNCIKIRTNSSKTLAFCKEKNQSKLYVVLNTSLNDIEGALSSNTALSNYFK